MSGPALVPAGYPGAVPPLAVLLRRHRSPLTWVSMIVLGVGGLAVAVVLFLVGGPVGTLVTTLLAAVSFPLLIGVCFWLDRYEPEPARYRIAALGWGAIVAVVLSFVLEQLLFAIPNVSEVVKTAVFAPMVEEAGKGLFLVALLVFRRTQVHGLIDGIVYAALVGIGFAFVEDIVYYLGSLDEGALPMTFFLRGVMSPFAHPLFTSATGVGVGISVSTRSRPLRLLAPLAGYLVAVALHATWNGSTFFDGGNGFLVAYAAIMLPLLITVLVVAIWARFREGKMLDAALQQVAQRGWVNPDEIRWVARLSDRMSARAYAKRVGGRPAQQALRAYQQTMTEVAFLHQRAVQGTAGPDLNQRMSGLLQHAAELRPYVAMPPPPRPAFPPPPYGYRPG